MKAADLLAWQAKHGLSQVAAARRLAAPVPTYRHWLYEQRRIPPNIELLCKYIDCFGFLGDESVRNDCD